MRTHVSVKVIPGASKDALEQTKKGSFLASVRAKAERNEANEAAARLLARHYGVTRSAVRLLRGARTRNKIFSLELSQPSV